MFVLSGSQRGAAADQPPTPVAAFKADPCPGDTYYDPEVAASFGPGYDAGDVPDLTLVFGARLDAYNTGGLAVLYDSSGTNNRDVEPDQGEIDFRPYSTGFPPLCVVRYVDGIGPVSEWMFCSDAFKHACGGTDADGNILHFEGEPLAPLEELPGNPKLDADHERLIAYLLMHGHPFEGVGSFDFGGVTEAASDLGTDERMALQELVWCVSDPPVVPDPSADQGTIDHYDMCQLNMGPAVQAELLSMIPETRVAQLALDGPGGSVAIGESAEFVLSTNLYNQPITLTFAEGSGVIEVVSAGASL